MPEPFNDPRIALNRIYTKAAIKARRYASRAGSAFRKVPPAIEAYGTVDELNAFIGLACVTCHEDTAQAGRLGKLTDILRRVQHERCSITDVDRSSVDAAGKIIHPKQASHNFGRNRTTRATEIDAMNEELPHVAQFRCRAEPGSTPNCTRRGQFAVARNG
jgi:cob(I)alamin adenosyltransferase